MRKAVAESCIVYRNIKLYQIVQSAARPETDQIISERASRQLLEPDGKVRCITPQLPGNIRKRDFLPVMRLNIILDLLGRKELRNGRFDCIITKSIERFAPTSEETIQVIEELLSLQNPVTVIFESDMLDSNVIHSVIPILRGCCI